MMHLRLVPEDTKIDFFRIVRVSAIVSILSVIVSISLIAFYGLNYGVDFRGGTLIMASTPEAQPMADFRTELTSLDIGDVGVTQVSDSTGADRNLVLMRLGITGSETDTQAVVSRVRTALEGQFPGIRFLQVDSVGAKVSAELVRGGILAVALSFLAIMVYVWLRFEWQFAVGAVISLVHDSLVTIGIFSLFQLEFNLTIVAGILTVIGYSINDTVVVFDRVRENLRKYKKAPLRDVMNLALNETLSRTVMTSLTTLLALLAIFFFGGSVVSGFAVAVIWGVLTGTYSSIYVASALVLWLGVKRDWTRPDATAGTQFGNVKA